MACGRELPQAWSRTRTSRFAAFSLPKIAASATQFTIAMMITSATPEPRLRISRSPA